MKKNFTAFTLAEVLIALTIIGVVAALTIPTLITKYQKQQTATRLKLTYAQLNQAVRLAQAEYGDPNTWDYTLDSQSFFEKYVTNYLKQYSKVKLNTVLPEYKTLAGDIMSRYIFYYSSNNVNVISLPSGVWLMYYINTPSSAVRTKDFLEFQVDINGANPPNVLGKDLFILDLLSNGQIIFQQRKDYENINTRRSRNELLTPTSDYYTYACNKSQSGLWCGALIQADNWEIKDDYPW